MRIIKWTFAVLAVLSAAVAGAYLVTPLVLGHLVNLDCKRAETHESCMTRMRALGHAWSRRGDLGQAKHWYSRAAERGDAAAMFHLAWIHEELALGHMTDWFRQKIGLMEAGRYREAARSGLELEGFQLAMAWYQRSADRGFAPAMNNLAQMYLSGLGGVASRESAFRWHLAAARAGNPVGRMNVAIAYSAGHGVAPDPDQVAKWASWSPSDVRAGDLLEPTLARTRLFGTSLPAKERERLRAGAKAGAQVTMMLKPFEGDPSLPTFQEVEGALPNGRP